MSRLLWVRGAFGSLVLAAAAACIQDEFWSDDLEVESRVPEIMGRVVIRTTPGEGCSESVWVEERVGDFAGEGLFSFPLEVEEPRTRDAVFVLAWRDDGNGEPDCDEPGQAHRAPWTDGWERVTVDDANWILGGAGLGCGDGGSSDDDTGDPDGLTSIVEMDPPPGATDAWYRQDVRVRFERPVIGADVLLGDPGGEQVPGSVGTSEDGTEAWFDPYGADPFTHLAPVTSYDVTVTWDGGDSQAWTFTTSAVGTPLADPDGVPGTVYAFDLSRGTWTSPPGLGSIISPFADGVPVLLSPLALDPEGGTSSFLQGGGLYQGGSLLQDACVPTSTLEGEAPLGFADPRYGAEADSAWIRLGSLASVTGTVPLTGVRVEGDLASDGGSVSHATFAGTADTRPLDALLGSDEGGTCELASIFGISCMACPGDGEPACLAFVVEDLAGERIEAALAPIDTETAAERDAAGECL